MSQSPPENTIGQRLSGATRLGITLTILWVGAGARSASAQWGWGGGWGWGGFGGGQIGNMAIMNNINDRSAAAANYAYSTRQSLPGSGNVYRNNPNAYINNVRDTSFFQRYDVATRRTMENSVSRRPVTSTASASATPSRTVLPLASFFSAAGKLIWPSESPTTGQLGDKKQAANTASEAVYRDVGSRGFAPVALVSDARTRLVEYGRPALSYMREHTTPAVVDSFHKFLLGIYDAIGSASTPASKP
jgi:hypothetical protein